MPPRKPTRSLRDVVAELSDRATPAALPRGYGQATIEAAVRAGEVRYRPDGVLEVVPRVGAPPRSGVAASRRIDLRATPDEEARWRAAAKAAGVGLRRWIADAANEKASR